jgi:hypothetical protein
MEMTICTGGATARPWGRDALRVVGVVVIVIVMVIAAKAGITVPDVITLVAAAALAAEGRPALPGEKASRA